MKYRKLGYSGTKVSEISLGSWLTYGNSTQKDVAVKTIKTAYENGINFFDTANTYAKGEAEKVVGEVLRQYPRSSYVLATKVWGPMGDLPNDRGLSRKQIVSQADASLSRLGLDYVDIYYCHSFDYDTDMTETLRTMDDLIRKGKVLYVGVSNWTAAQIAEALHIADRYLLDRIVVSQPVYNMLSRDMEDELMGLCAREGISQAVYSPLAQGLLTGKYTSKEQIPSDSRAADTRSNRFIERYLHDDVLEKTQKLASIAKQAGTELPQMALAWVLRQPNVASAIIGASKPSQIEQNIKAVDVVLDDDLQNEIDRVLQS